MPNPKRRHSKQRRDKRRANWKLVPVNLPACPQCKQPKMSHFACSNCGYYKGRKVIEVE